MPAVEQDPKNHLYEQELISKGNKTEVIALVDDNKFSNYRIFYKCSSSSSNSMALIESHFHSRRNAFSLYSCCISTHAFRISLIK